MAKRIHPAASEDSVASGRLSRLSAKQALQNHGRTALIGTSVLFVLLLSVGDSMFETYRSINASRSAFIVLDKSLQFTSDYAPLSSDFQLLTLIYGYSENLGTYYAQVLDETLEGKMSLFQRLEASYRHHKKKAPALRKTNTEFKELREFFYGIIEGDLLLYDAIKEVRNTSSVLNFDSYVLEVANSKVFELGYEDYREFQDKIKKFSDELRKISLISQTNTQHITLAVQFILFIVLLGFAFSLHKHFKESSIKLAAQDKLVRQQMHEARNKFCPAMYMMEQFLETAHRKNSTVHDFKSLADDMHMALVALKEVEAQHQARLDMYKILKGNYLTKKETFDILELMRERTAVERTVALARARATNSPIAEFVSAIEDKSNPQHNTSGALFVQTDLYILNHVIANLLSNARKFCPSGQIKICFNGTQSDDLLLFSVRDSGSGLPEVLRNEHILFGQGVLSGDNRGTGLGLPSCHLFCKAGGGYIKLKGTKQVDEHSGGYTEFEFALSGKIIRADKKRPSISSNEDNEEVEHRASIDDLARIEEAKIHIEETANDSSTPAITSIPSSTRLKPSTCPNDVKIVAIDDSALNRTCVIRSFKKIERASSARGFQYFQFETIESSMPFFRELEDTSKVIVLIDENLDSRGGVLHGIQCTRWLLHELHFSGLIISTSGDPDVGKRHLEEGPNVLNWGKPLPKFEKMLADVEKALESSMITASPPLPLT